MKLDTGSVQTLRGTDAFVRSQTLLKMSISHLVKGVYFKRKEFAPLSFKVDPFSEGVCDQQRKWDIKKVASFWKSGKNLPSVSIPPDSKAQKQWSPIFIILPEKQVSMLVSHYRLAHAWL